MKNVKKMYPALAGLKKSSSNSNNISLIGMLLKCRDSRFLCYSGNWHVGKNLTHMYSEWRGRSWGGLTWHGQWAYTE
jgi:hypothetical protein